MQLSKPLNSPDNCQQMSKLAAQDEFGADTICFGCGPANEKGLQIKSHWEGDDFIMYFRSEKHHQAFPGVINGGILGTLLDCHMNWAVATRLHELAPEEAFPSTVTSEFSVQLLKPTPFDKELRVVAQVTKIKGRVGFTEAQIFADGEMTAKSSGVFVAVKEGHPAFHRW